MLLIVITPDSELSVILEVRRTTPFWSCDVLWRHRTS